MARKVAHEIKNPLTPIQLSAEHLLRVFEDKREDFEPALRESMSYIVSEVDNLRRIAQEFLEMSREVVERREPLALDDLVAETVDALPEPPGRRIQFATEVEGGDFTLDGRPGQAQDRPAQPPDQRHRVHPRQGGDPSQAVRRSGADHPAGSRTPASGSKRTSWTGSSSPISRPRTWGRGWACRSPGRSSRTTAARSRSRASPDTGPSSRSDSGRPRPDLPPSGIFRPAMPE